MLVLSRKKNERVELRHKPSGELIGVVLVEIRGDKVRLGFDAPQTVEIWREELEERREEGGDAAAQTAAALTYLASP